MQKALILALLIGAFLLPRYLTAQEVELPLYHCPDGNSVTEYQGNQICPTGVGYGIQYRVQGQSVTSAPAKDIPTAAADWASKKSGTINNGCSITNTYTYLSHDQYGGVTFRHDQVYFTGAGCQVRNTYTTTTGATYGQLPPTYYCPPDDAPSPGYVNLGGEGASQFCWKLAEQLPTDEEPPPGCDIGDCNPPEEPKCFRGGNGQLVCFEDPNDKCDVQTVNEEPVYSNCETGCGFVQDNFLCSEEPDIPSLDNCLVTTNGYACPSDIPEPDDTIDNPEKPIDNMVKGDFKDVLLGVETRTDATNKLISDQIARDAENTEKLAVGLGKANQYLAAIDKNTKEIADGMEDLKGDGSSADLGTGAQFKAEIQNALGITGDETIEDLTVAEVSLDDFTDDFQWSLGPDQCPQPRAINMLGKTFYMDWGPFCEAFTVLGYLILAAAYFFATLIAFRGK